MYARDSTVIATPVGHVLIEGREVVTRIRIGVEDAPYLANADAPRAAAEQLEAYFAGERRDFDLLLAPSSTSRGEVLRAAIAAVGDGETASYGEVARAIGSSARAWPGVSAESISDRHPLPPDHWRGRALFRRGRASYQELAAEPRTRLELNDG